MLTFDQIIKADGCSSSVAYRYIRKHGTMEGFEHHGEHYPMRYQYKGERLSAREIARRLGVHHKTVHYQMRKFGTMDGYEKREDDIKDRLDRFYHTLNDSIPLDRAIAAKGYRSIRQFCLENGINYGMVVCWRNGKPFHSGSFERELFNNGFSQTMQQLMEATGCLEYDLFPNVFNEDFYRRQLDTRGVKPQPKAEYHPTVELRDGKRMLEFVLTTLSAKQRDVIRRYFNINRRGGQNLAQIGRDYGLQREWIRQVFLRALRKLRHPTRLKMLTEAYGITEGWGPVDERKFKLV